MTDTRSLSAQELTRYSRHIILPGVGVPGQQRLREARVAVIGAGGLGSPVILYLAAAGVGTIGVVDDDVVDVSNLQRQVLHSSSRTGMLKTESAKIAVHELNPHVEVIAHSVRLSPENALSILAEYDIVVDGTDNYEARYLVSDACVLLRKPLVWGSVFQFEGQVSVWWAGRGPCYRCAFPEPPAPGLVPSCAEGGVFGAMCASVGAAQVAEALKLVLGIGQPALGRLLVYDALGSRWRTLTLLADPQCPACGHAPTITDLDATRTVCGVASRDTLIAEVTPEDLAAILADRPESVRLIDVRGPQERAIVSVPGDENIPLQQFEDGSALRLLSARDDLILYCRSGIRSESAARLIPDGHVNSVKHLAGGLLEWIRQVSPGLPTY